jgi:hypothetical protein
MNVFTPEFAPLVVLGFLGTGFLLFLLALAAGISFFAGKRVLGKRLATGGIAVAGGYLALLLAFSFLSREETLKKGDRKYFCEIDCHLAYSLQEASQTRALGVPPHLVAARGVFHVATIKTWFDERTIASFRGNGPLTPNPRAVFVVDDSGRLYEPSLAGQKALEESHGLSTPLTRMLRPGASYTTTLVFDLPEGVRNPRLLVTDSGEIPERFLIGHEKSLFHKKIFFALRPESAEARSRGFRQITRDSSPNSSYPHPPEA